jgi:hypothetical protein
MSELRSNQKIGGKILAATVAAGTLLCLIGIAVFLTSCSSSNSNLDDRVEASRVFNNVSIEVLDRYTIPHKQDFKNTVIGGLSGLTYDRQKDRFYAVSDDRGQNSPARFYTLKLNLDRTNPARPKLTKVEVEDVTLLKNEKGENYPAWSIDPEAIAVAPDGGVWISSEGDRQGKIEPFIARFDLKGNIKQKLTIPDRYLLGDNKGIQNNLAFESMTLSLDGEPRRLFAVTENPLVQDVIDGKDTKAARTTGGRSRWLHYLLGSSPSISSEHLYSIDPAPVASLEHGISEIQPLDNSGHFITLERSFGLYGFRVKLFQAATPAATDTSKIASFKSNVGNIQPIAKQLLWDSKTAKQSVDNVEGMAIGPRLPDGSNLFLTVSDDNFRKRQSTQFLLFKLTQK